MVHSYSRLEQKKENPEKGAKPLREDSKMKLLSIIAAISKMARIDLWGIHSTSEIVSETDNIGYPVSDDTVKKYLVEARELLPRPITIEQKKPIGEKTVRFRP
jgi:hypothetical protein